MTQHRRMPRLPYRLGHEFTVRNGAALFTRAAPFLVLCVGRGDAPECRLALHRKFVPLGEQLRGVPLRLGPAFDFDGDRIHRLLEAIETIVLRRPGTNRCQSQCCGGGGPVRRPYTLRRLAANASQRIRRSPSGGNPARMAKLVDARACEARVRRDVRVRAPVRARASRHCAEDLYRPSFEYLSGTNFTAGNGDCVIRRGPVSCYRYQSRPMWRPPTPLGIATVFDTWATTVSPAMNMRTVNKTCASSTTPGVMRFSPGRLVGRGGWLPYASAASGVSRCQSRPTCYPLGGQGLGAGA